MLKLLVVLQGMCRLHGVLHGMCRQYSDGVGDGQCEAAAGVVDRPPLHHSPAAAPRGGPLLAGVKPYRPCSGAFPPLPPTPNP